VFNSQCWLYILILITLGSVPSLVAGVGFGAAAGYAAARVSQNPKDSLFALGILFHT
jgi:F0F1-type ATP synthase membrane subunit c/vacuolar-type H+-ATPase subunit K